jgi:hypothetical protein
VLEQGGWTHAIGSAKYGTVDYLKGEKIDMPGLKNEAFFDMVRDSYNTFSLKAAKKLEDFKVKKKLLNTSPFQAKIGTKESIKTDHKFFVYEYVWDEEKEKAIPKRKGVLRVKKAVDNRENRSEKSSFYQIYGGSIEEGMVLREKPDLGLSVITGYEVSGPGGINLGLKYRLGKYINIPASYLTANIAFTNEDYSNYQVGDYNYLGNFETEEVSFTRFEAGVGKGFQLARFLSLCHLPMSALI